jgi:Rod binding domain-containing protein
MEPGMNALKPLNTSAMQTPEPLAANEAPPSAPQTSQSADATQLPIDKKALAHASEQFESMFIKQMLNEMNNATREMSAQDSPLRDSTSNSMLDYANTFVADSLASQHAFGISDFIVRQMTPGQAQLDRAAARNPQRNLNEKKA